MVVLNQKRRSVLMGLAGLGVGHALLRSAAEAEGAASQGYPACRATTIQKFEELPYEDY